VSNFVSYNSSAGSGKTYTLVKEYLKIALETRNQNQYRHILAVTFTNKAAAEMKERILEALKALSSEEELTGTPKFLLADLLKPKEEGGLGVHTHEISVRSKNVLKSILHNYNDFGISTIDKFTHKIIRTFAHDLHLPLNFNIELDEKELLGASIDMLIAEVGTNKKLTKLLLEYTSKKAESEESWHIEKDLFNFSRNLLKEDGELYLKKIRKLSINDFEKIKTKLYQQTKNFESKVKQMGVEGLQFIKDKGIAHDSFSRSFYPKYWENLSVLKKLVATDTTLKIIGGESNWYAAKVDDSQKSLIDTHQQELIQLFETSRTYLNKFESDYKVNKLIIKNLYSLAMLNEIEKTLQEFKKDNSVLNISDFNKKIAGIVSSEPVPFIYERLGEKYNHYLIDEFQDTSIIQWHNIIPLIDNSLASGKFNMVVGDAKQAIYRFRGGEVEQIIQLPKIFRHNNNPLLIERENALTRNFLNKNLEKNYRSKVEIVKFNNDFFQSVAPHLTEQYQQLYKNLTQEFFPINAGGAIDIEFAEESENQTYREVVLSNIYNIIKNNCKDGYSLRDIAILTRSNKDGSEIASFLLENNINVVSSESLLLNNSEEVTFLLNIYRYLSSPNDKNYQVHLLNYLTQNVYKEDDLFHVFIETEGNKLQSYLNSKNIEIDFKQIVNYSLYELAEYLVILFDFDKKVDVYIQFFLDKVHDYASRNDNSVVNFIEWWDTRSDKFSIVIPEGIEAVKVMSIHKAKGLEFPIVIYPFATSSVKAGEDFFWTSKTNINGLESAIIPILKDLDNTRFADVYKEEMAKSTLDLINMLYVALTRPKDRLYIISKIEFSKGKRKTSTNGSVADYLFDFCDNNPAAKLDEHHYQFGIFTPKENKEIEKPINDKVFDTISYNNWREKIQISYQSPTVWDVEKPETIGEHGNLIHNILSKVKVKDDLERVLASFLQKGLIAEDKLPAVRIELENVFKIEGVNDLFADFDDLKNERSILIKKEASGISDRIEYIPDRVVFKDNKVIIIDYKTGKKEGDKHINQIKGYKDLLSKMGEKNIESYLLYTKEGKLEKV
jgi:ATP-dependent exoDNAse (exonuclease V) beta subunit